MVCPEDVNNVRTSPFMIYRNMENMNIHDIKQVIKIDDTSSGIIEGNNAGCWTVGVAKYSVNMNIYTEEMIKEYDIIENMSNNSFEN